MRFVHIADVHLGAIPDGNKPWATERARELWDTFSEVIDVCNEKKADLLLIAGNLFHRQPLKRELKEVNALFEKLERTRVVLMAGDRDYLKETSAYLDFTWDESVHFFTSATPEKMYFEDLDCEIWGMSYHTPTITEPLYDSIPQKSRKEVPSDSYRILLAHGGEDDHIPFRKDRLMEKDFDYIALGHEPIAQMRDRDRMAYAGSLEPISENEPGEHGYIIGEITEEGTSFELIPISQRQYITVQVPVVRESTTQTLVDAVRKIITEQGDQNLYTLNLVGRFNPQKPIDLDELEKTGNIVRINDKTQAYYDILKIAHEHDGDLVGEYLEALHKLPPSPLTNKALYYGLSALLADQE